MKNRFREELTIALVASGRWNQYSKESIDKFIEQFCEDYGHDLQIEETNRPIHGIDKVSNPVYATTCRRCGKQITPSYDSEDEK